MKKSDKASAGASRVAETSSAVMDIAARLQSGDRFALARAITLVESTLENDQNLADQLLNELLPRSGKSVRIGVSGVPGVGKSSFIEKMGLSMLAEGRRIAVLAVDPSSPISGGSIMGDKTRMEEIARDDRVFVRPSPSSGNLGGVGRRTREAIVLCEAAGFDTIIVETVGVGQSEFVVASMVDVFLALQLPGAGDELQGIKKGILELADIVAITKADGDLLTAARLAKAEHDRALSLVRGHHDVKVLLTSSVLGDGIIAVRDTIGELISKARSSGNYEERRKSQVLRWFRDEVGHLLHERAFSSGTWRKTLETWESAVVEGKVSAGSAARRVISTVMP